VKIFTPPPKKARCVELSVEVSKRGISGTFFRAVYDFIDDKIKNAVYVLNTHKHHKQLFKQPFKAVYFQKK